MYNLNDIVQASHDGRGVQTLADQFNISQAEAQAAIEAVLPALSHGLQMKMQEPYGMAQLFSGMANGRGVAAFSNPDAATAPETQQFGNDMLGQIFGGSGAQQVAAHAARSAGVSVETLQQMLPEITAMVLGGLFKAASNSGLGGILGQVLQGGMASRGGQQPAGAGPQSGGSLGDILGGIFGGNAGGQPPQPGSAGTSTQGGGLGGGLGDILGQVLQGGMGRQGGGGPQSGGGLADILGGLFGGNAGGLPPQPGQAPSPNAPSPGAPSPGAPAPGSAGGFDATTIQAGIDMLGKMLGHGTRQSPEQQSGLDDVLGQIFGGNKPR